MDEVPPKDGVITAVGGTVTEGEAAAVPAAVRVLQLTSQVAALRESVIAGQVFLDKDAGDALLSLLTEQLDQVDGWVRRANAMTRRVPLGQNPVGEAMAAKIEGRAGAADTSFQAVLTSYRGVLQEAHDTVAAAMRQYADVERENADTFTRLAQ